MADEETPADEDDEPTKVQGAFDPETRTIYIAPDLLDDEDSEDDDG